VHISREVSATARVDGAVGQRLIGGLIGLTLEWSPWRAAPSPREPWEL
jgi:hypothetical protein